MRLWEISKALDERGLLVSSQVLPGASVKGFGTDTRTLSPGDWFVALRGPNFDGHSFCSQARDIGAAGMVVSDDSHSPDLPRLVVTDTLAAYGAIANLQRQQLAARVTAITGSSGKTTTKECLAHLLRGRHRVHAGIANENNDIGVPKTILSAPRDCEHLILEMGMRGLGQIATLAEIAEPDLTAVTNIGTAHLEMLGSRANIARAKAEIFLGQRQGLTFLPPEEPLLEEWAARSPVPVKRFSQPRGIDWDPELGRSEFQLDGARYSVPIYPNPGLISSLAAAIDLAQELGLDHGEIAASLATFRVGKGRGAIDTILDGMVTIDDTYNANPESVLALARGMNLMQKQAGSPISVLVLGEISELGPDGPGMIRELRQQAGQLLDELVYLPEQAPDADSRRRLLARLAGLPPGSLVGFKGSRESRTERLIQALCSLGSPQESLRQQH